LGCSFMTAQKLIDEFEKLGLLVEKTGNKRNKRYEYAPYLAFWMDRQEEMINQSS